MSEFFSRDAQQIGCVEDMIAHQSLLATYVAFNQIATAAEIRQKVAQDDEKMILNGQMSSWAAIISLTKGFRAHIIEKRGRDLLPPNDPNY